jgi:integrase
MATGFRWLGDQAGIAGVSFRDLRRVSGRLGHANASTTLNVYAHFLEASDPGRPPPSSEGS